MATTHQAYERVALEDPDGQWELHEGKLREKPPMSFGHNHTMSELGFDLRRQLDPTRYAVRVNAGRARRADETYYIPDVFVIPIELMPPLPERWDMLEVYDQPLPLVVEVWLPSTGAYDVDAKLPEYRRRGDFEIWRLHPRDRTLRAWRRRPDGTYDEAAYHGGIVEPIALPGVRVDLDAIWP